MAGVIYNESTKKVDFSEDYLSSLSETDRHQAEATVVLVNRLMADLVAHNQDIPPAAGTVSENVSRSAASLLRSGNNALRQGKFSDGHKLFSTALETILRRPLWESPAMFFEEVAACLGPLCDTNINLEKYDEAYGQVSLLMMLKPTDAVNHFRKGILLVSAHRNQEALEYLRTANAMAPNQPVFEHALKKVLAE